MLKPSATMTSENPGQSYSFAFTTLLSPDMPGLCFGPSVPRFHKGQTYVLSFKLLSKNHFLFVLYSQKCFRGSSMCSRPFTTFPATIDLEMSFPSLFRIVAICRVPLASRQCFSRARPAPSTIRQAHACESKLKPCIPFYRRSPPTCWPEHERRPALTHQTGHPPRSPRTSPRRVRVVAPLRTLHFSTVDTTVPPRRSGRNPSASFLTVPKTPAV